MLSGEARAPAGVAALREKIWGIAESVCDPELPVLSIVDLGILRDVRIHDAGLEIIITPTYSGCPAMDVIALDLSVALDKAGIHDAKITLALAPAWTTDWMSEAGRRKLAEYGIVPPPAAGRAALFGVEAIACPCCGSLETEEISRFGSTACKSLWRCKTCREPFDCFKCL